MTDGVSYGDLTRELGTFVRRLRDLPPGRRSERQASLVRHVVDVVAAAALAAEGRPPTRVPDLGAPALADQLAVVGHDLVAARPAPDVVLCVFAELVLHRTGLDGAAPGRKAVQLLAGAYGVPETVSDVLAVAAARCPATTGNTETT